MGNSLIANWKVFVKRNRPPGLVMRRWNAIVTLALNETGKFWIKEFLPLHFQPSAVQRYSLAARRSAYLLIKQKVDYLNIGFWSQKQHQYIGQRVKIAKPTAPLVLTGNLRDSLLAKARGGGLTIKTTATSNKAIVRVKCPIPHPINPKNKGEITRLIRPEIEAMNKVFVRMIKDEIAKLQESSTTVITATGISNPTTTTMAV